MSQMSIHLILFIIVIMSVICIESKYHICIHYIKKQIAFSSVMYYNDCSTFWQVIIWQKKELPNTDR